MTYTRQNMANWLGLDWEQKDYLLHNPPPLFEALCRRVMELEELVCELNHVKRAGDKQ